ncbi:ABC transporter permease [Eubacteriales bacterium OttesenSCG-928-A19]|nr:ABC transporter permease [Eubacteriales bacterium OttesenSCG-928-A19]
MLERWKKFQFLFVELIKRDFKKKYKRTFFGMLWSVISPLLQLLVMSLVFRQFFGRNTPHYTIYLFSGNLIFSYFSDATNGGMRSLLSNASIFSRVNVPKYMFLFSRVLQSFINFLLTLAVYFIFVAIDGVPFSLSFFALIYPILCLTVFNIGVGMILSALYVFFRDIEYLYSVFTMLLMYVSAIFYTIDAYAPHIQRLFLCNPIYVYIKYFRVVVLEGHLPSLEYHLLGAGYALVVFVIGFLIYRKYNYKFLYYV